MNHWKRVSDKYPDFLINHVRVPSKRLSALSKIEQFLKEQYPGILSGHTNFIYIDKFELRRNYEIWKGKKINSSETQVFNDFYKLAR